MPVKSLRRGPSAGGAPADFLNRSNAVDVYVDGATGAVVVGSGASGTTTATTYVGSGMVSATAATLAVTSALHNGKTIVLNRAAGVTVTLPAATGTGARFRFSIATALSAATHVIKVANATDYMRGVIVSKDDGSASSVISWATANSGSVATESDTLTMDGSTQGGNIGDIIEIEDIASAVFRVSGFTKSSGTEATPFSAGV